MKHGDAVSRRIGNGGFLDRKVEASLKLAAPERCTLALHRFLDRKVEASLKPIKLAHGHSSTAAIPRPKGRGLIEARPDEGPLLEALQGFLDRKVEASLKPIKLAHGHSSTAAIPRPKGRGLIEAPWEGWQAASARGFLDRKVEASLKLHRFVDAQSRAKGIPRPKGRGLIEAEGGAAFRGRDGLDSSTERSRPH